MGGGGGGCAPPLPTGLKTLLTCQSLNYLVQQLPTPGAPLTYLLTGDSRDFFESEILAKREILGSTKGAGNSLVRKKNTGILFLVFYIPLAQINSNKSVI